MTLAISPESPPLKVDASGDIRVGSSRVLLDLVIRAFEDGATPEAIVQRYPTLGLSDVYGAIHYYLRHPDEIARYLPNARNGRRTHRRAWKPGRVLIYPASARGCGPADRPERHAAVPCQRELHRLTWRWRFLPVA